jgi:formylglycine-generating enzyme required for sulfatase activity
VALRIRNVLLALTCAIAAPAVAATAPAAPPGANKALVDSHHAKSRRCFECHKESDDPAFKQIVKESCIECHPKGWYKGKLEALAKEPEMPANRPTQRASGQGPGMSLPMYYPRTRRGDSPGEMIKIPAGKFIRGTNGRLPDEGPQHEITLPAFLIDKYEVTNLQYKKFIDAAQRPAPDHFVGRNVPEGKADHPVVYVTWNDAKAYCEWAGKRLPNDKEWEKAARGTDGRTFPWGEEFDINKVNSPVRWANLNLVGDTTPVGAFEGGKSPFGLYDVSGNVWEWTASGYEAYPGNTRPSENYGGNYKVLKGGSWWDCSFYQCGISAPMYNRSFFHPLTKNDSFGFRCAKDAQ